MDIADTFIVNNLRQLEDTYHASWQFSVTFYVYW